MHERFGTETSRKDKVSRPTFCQLFLLELYGLLYVVAMENFLTNNSDKTYAKPLSNIFLFKLKGIISMQESSIFIFVFLLLLLFLL
jgi:hypothetical protein